MATVREKAAALSLSTVCSPAARPPGTAGHRHRGRRAVGRGVRAGTGGAGCSQPGSGGMDGTALPAVGCGSPPAAAALCAFPGCGKFKNWPRSGSRFRPGFPSRLRSRSPGRSGSFGPGGSAGLRGLCPALPCCTCPALPAELWVLGGLGQLRVPRAG